MPVGIESGKCAILNASQSTIYSCEDDGLLRSRSSQTGAYFLSVGIPRTNYHEPEWGEMKIAVCRCFALEIFFPLIVDHNNFEHLTGLENGH